MKSAQYRAAETPEQRAARLKRARDWDREHPEKAVERSLRYRAKNPEKCKVWQKRYDAKKQRRRNRPQDMLA